MNGGSSAGVPASVYVHVPFCARKCFYCDFVSYPYEAAAARRYVAALRREVELRAAGAEGKQEVATVYVGGGTPTCLSQDLLVEIISLIREYFVFRPGLEFTVEVNPGTVNRAKFAVLRRLGVNRISIGAQACCTKTLRVLGRAHTHEQTADAVRQAREAGFDNINLDLIYGVPGQTSAGWRRCLELITALQPEHISAYGLQLEPGTPLHEMVNRGLLAPCAEETQVVMYYDAVDTLTAAGYNHYELSNFARPGRECRHNLVYWQNGEYLGLGPTAHSHLHGRRQANESDLEKYAAVLAEGRLPLAWSEEVDRAGRIFETIFLGLRLTAGLDIEDFRQRFGCTPVDLYPAVIAGAVNKGLLELRGKYMRLTRRGLVVANAVMAEFAPGDNS